MFALVYAADLACGLSLPCIMNGFVWEWVYCSVCGTALSELVRHASLLSHSVTVAPDRHVGRLILSSRSPGKILVSSKDIQVIFTSPPFMHCTIRDRRAWGTCTQSGRKLSLLPELTHAKGKCQYVMTGRSRRAHCNELSGHSGDDKGSTQTHKNMYERDEPPARGTREERAQRPGGTSSNKGTPIDPSPPHPRSPGGERACPGASRKAASSP